MAEKTERVGLVIGADASAFSRAMDSMVDDAERLDKILGKGGLFDSKDLRDYDSAMQRVERRVHTLVHEYRRLGEETARYQEHLDDIQKSGGQATSQQVARGAALRQRMAAVASQIGDQQQRVEAAKEDRSALARSVATQMYTRKAAESMGVPTTLGGMMMWPIQRVLAGIDVLNRYQQARLQSEGVGFAGRNIGQIEKAGRDFGYFPGESHQIAIDVARAGGRTDPRGARSTMAMMRGYNLDTSALTGLQRGARRMGEDEGAAAQTLNRALLQAVQMGNVPRVLMQEFATATSSAMGIVADAQHRTSARQTMGLVGVMGRVMGYERTPERTTALLGGIHSTITAPGGGDAGQAFMMRALGLGSGRSYVDVLEQMEKGIGDPTNIAAMVGQIRTEYGGHGEDMQRLALHRLSGGRIKLHQARRLLGADEQQLGQLGYIDQLMGGVDIGDETAEGRRGSGRRLGMQKMLIEREGAQAAYAANAQTLIKMVSDFQRFMDANIASLIGKVDQGVRDIVQALGGIQNILSTSKQVAHAPIRLGEWIGGQASNFVHGTPNMRSLPARNPRRVSQQLKDLNLHHGAF
jgi:hypothetical protein